LQSLQLIIWVTWNILKFSLNQVSLNWHVVHFKIIITFLDIIGTRRHIASLVNCLELKINSSQRFFGKKFISRTWLKKMLMANFVHLFKFYLHEHWNVSTLQNKYSRLIFFWIVILKLVHVICIFEVE